MCVWASADVVELKEDNAKNEARKNLRRLTLQMESKQKMKDKAIFPVGGAATLCTVNETD